MTRAESDKTAIKDWKNMRFGMFIHWGPCTVEGVEIGWDRGTTHESVKAYDQMYKRFNPVNFNACCKSESNIFRQTIPKITI